MKADSASVTGAHPGRGRARGRTTDKQASCRVAEDLRAVLKWPKRGCRSPRLTRDLDKKPGLPLASPSSTSSPVPAHRPELPCHLLAPARWLWWKFAFKTIACENCSGKEAYCAEAVSVGVTSAVASCSCHPSFHRLFYSPVRHDSTWSWNNMVTWWGCSVPTWTPPMKLLGLLR